MFLCMESTTLKHSCIDTIYNGYHAGLYFSIY